jgi:hypothetical protein
VVYFCTPCYQSTAIFTTDLEVIESVQALVILLMKLPLRLIIRTAQFVGSVARAIINVCTEVIIIISVIRYQSEH